MPTFLALLGMFISVLLIGIILLQRGRGGGLVGALSGLGGQSAFGTKAGDMFTRITIGLAFVWVLLAGGHGILLRGSTEIFKNEKKQPSAISQDKGSGPSKSDDSKAASGVGTSSNESKPENIKESDSKSTKKSDEPSKEITPDEVKKPDSAPKTKEPPKKELDESSDSKSDDKSGDKK